MYNTKKVFRNILGDRCSKSFKYLLNVGDIVSWDYGDGTAKVISINDSGVVFLVSEFNREFPGSKLQSQKIKVKKTWNWLNANPGFLKK